MAPTNQDVKFENKVAAIFTGLGARNITHVEDEDINFVMDEVLNNDVMKCAVRCETRNILVGRDSVQTFYNALRRVLVYDGKKRGYLITPGSFLKDARDKVREINNISNIEILLVSGADLAKHEVPKVVSPFVVKHVEEVKPVEAVKVEAVKVEQSGWFKKKEKKPKAVKQPKTEVTTKPKREKRENVIFEVFYALGKDFSSIVSSLATDVLSDLSFGALIIFGILCVVFCGLLVLSAVHFGHIPIDTGNGVYFY